MTKDSYLEGIMACAEIPADKPDEATPAAPGAIDLVQRLRDRTFSWRDDDFNEAAIAVEALRARNTKLSRKNREYAFAMGNANDRADAAEALERGRAVETVVTVARQCVDRGYNGDPLVAALDAALAKLDALNKDKTP